MSLFSMVLNVVGKLFNAFKKTFMPDKKDFIGSILLTIPMYFLFSLSLIFLLPLIIIGIIVVYTLRRLWKILILYWTLRVMKKKTTKEIDRIKKLFR